VRASNVGRIAVAVPVGAGVGSRERRQMAYFRALLATRR